MRTALVVVGGFGMACSFVACVGDAADGGAVSSDGGAMEGGPLDASSFDAAVDTGAGHEAGAFDAGDAGDAAMKKSPTGSYLWNAHIGGAGDDSAGSAAAAYDGAGNLFVVGSFAGQASFGNAQTLTSLGSLDAFVAKYDVNGNCIGIARIGGASTVDVGVAVAVDPKSQDVVVTGTLFANASAPPISWSVNGGDNISTSNGAFLVKFSNDLSTVKFAQDFAANSSATRPTSLAIGPASAIVVSGTIKNATSSAFDRGGPPVPGSGLGGPTVGFVAQYSSSGALGFARVLSPLTDNPSCETFVGGAAFDSEERIVVAGWALGYAACQYSADYASNMTSNQIDGTKGNVFFVVKYDDANLGAFSSVKLTANTGGSGYPQAVAIGPNDEVYAAFDDEAQSFQFAGVTVPASSSDDGLVLAWDANGTEKSAYLFGGAMSDIPHALAVDPEGNVVIGGSVGSNVTFGPGKTLTYGGGIFDGFVMKMDPKLSNVLWLNAYGGAGREEVFGVAASVTEATGAVGAFDDTSFVVGPGKTITGSGQSDFFALGLNP